MGGPTKYEAHRTRKTLRLLKQQLLLQRGTVLEQDIETGDYEFNMAGNCNGKSSFEFLD
jgi:hypothetical protein